MAITEFEKPHPLSSQAAVSIFKKYLEEDKYKIRLHDLVKSEVEKLHENISISNFPVQGGIFSKEELDRRIKKYQSLSEILQSMMIVGGYWGNQTTDILFAKSLERLSDCLQQRNGLNSWLNLRIYPAVLLLFSTGLSALASQNFTTLEYLFYKTQNKDPYRVKEPLLLSLYASATME